MQRFLLLSAVALMLAAPAVLHASEGNVTLRGSRASMLRQNNIAKSESYSFLRTPSQLRRFVDDGRLVDLPGNTDYTVIAGYPFARPVVRTFVERIAGDYRATCGEQLVVTSLTRPALRQPRNASPLSVHPAGMAVDLRVSTRAACRDWLQRELLVLEQRGVLDATREHHPPHFHIAVFPTPYFEYEEMIAADSLAEARLRMAQAAADVARAALVRDAAVAQHVDGASPRLARRPLFARLVAWLALLVLPVGVSV